MDKLDPNLPVPVGALKEIIKMITDDIYKAINDSNEATADIIAEVTSKLVYKIALDEFHLFCLESFALRNFADQHCISIDKAKEYYSDWTKEFTENNKSLFKELVQDFEIDDPKEDNKDEN